MRIQESIIMSPVQTNPIVVWHFCGFIAFALRLKYHRLYSDEMTAWSVRNLGTTNLKIRFTIILTMLHVCICVSYDQRVNEPLCETNLMVARPMFFSHISLCICSIVIWSELNHLLPCHVTHLWQYLIYRYTYSWCSSRLSRGGEQVTPYPDVLVVETVVVTQASYATLFQRWLVPFTAHAL